MSHLPYVTTSYAYLPGLGFYTCLLRRRRKNAQKRHEVPWPRQGEEGQPASWVLLFLSRLVFCCSVCCRLHHCPAGATWPNCVGAPLAQSTQPTQKGCGKGGVEKHWQGEWLLEPLFITIQAAKFRQMPARSAVHAPALDHSGFCFSFDHLFSSQALQCIVVSSLTLARSLSGPCAHSAASCDLSKTSLTRVSKSVRLL